MAETTVDFGVRRSEFDSESSFSGRSGRHSQYTAGARSMADRSGTEITEYHSYMYAESHDTRSDYNDKHSYNNNNINNPEGLQVGHPWDTSRVMMKNSN